MSSMRALIGVVAMALALDACVPVDDGRLDREMPITGGSGGDGGDGAGGADSSGSGGASTSGSGGGGQGGLAGFEPENPVGGDGGGSALPAPNVNAIFQTGCAMATAKAELPQVNLLFVIDRSQSMACNPPPETSSSDCEAAPVRATDADSKWDITRDALKNAIRALPPQTVVGISYFSNDDACGVNSRPRIPLRTLAPGQIAAIEASLLNVTPNGSTPLVGATILAYHHLHDAALAGRIRGERFVVLLTDGEQSEMCIDAARCTDKQSCTDLLVNEEVRKASGPGVGIRTFVIGVPGSEPAREVLSTIAVEGGTAPEGCDASSGNCHFDMTEEGVNLATALSGALDQIVGRALSCELPLPEGTEEVDRDRVNVVYSSSLGMEPRVIPRDDTLGCSDGANGWQYAPNGKSIRLCGTSCDDARKDSGGRIDVVLGCPVQGPE